MTKMTHQKDDGLTLNVKFKVKDILRYNISVASKSLANKLVMGAGVLVLIYFFYKMFTRTVTLDIFISQNIVLLIVPLLIFFLIPWRIWQVTLSQMQMQSFAYGVTYIFSKENIVLDIGEEEDTMNWDVFVKIVETKHDFRFYVNAISAQIIPKHNFKEGELTHFRNIIKGATEASVYNLK